MRLLRATLCRIRRERFLRRAFDLRDYPRDGGFGRAFFERESQPLRRKDLRGAVWRRSQNRNAGASASHIGDRDELPTLFPLKVEHYQSVYREQ